jgi:Holliday junction resolvase RusA-like endonuclease
VKEIALRVLGKPVALSRVSAGQFGGRYLALASSKQIGAVVDAWERIGEPRFDDDVPLSLEVDFYFERPASHFGSGRNADKLKPSAKAEPTSRPDLSNLVKLVEDALNGNAYRDDSRIVRTVAAKRYGDRARTEIVLRPT